MEENVHFCYQPDLFSLNLVCVCVCVRNPREALISLPSFSPELVRTTWSRTSSGAFSLTSAGKMEVKILENPKMVSMASPANHHTHRSVSPILFLKVAP